MRIGGQAIAVDGHRAQVHQATYAGAGRRFHDVARALDVDAAGILERSASPGAVEDDVASGHGGGQRLGTGDVALHPIHRSTGPRTVRAPRARGPASARGDSSTAPRHGRRRIRSRPSPGRGPTVGSCRHPPVAADPPRRWWRRPRRREPGRAHRSAHGPAEVRDLGVVHVVIREAQDLQPGAPADACVVREQRELVAHVERRAGPAVRAAHGDAVAERVEKLAWSDAKPSPGKRRSTLGVGFDLPPVRRLAPV